MSREQIHERAKTLVASLGNASLTKETTHS